MAKNKENTQECFLLPEGLRATWCWHLADGGGQAGHAQDSLTSEDLRAGSAVAGNH